LLFNYNIKIRKNLGVQLNGPPSALKSVKLHVIDVIHEFRAVIPGW
jgi:hypothetical protein